MFGFGKKEMDMAAAEAFWNWYCANDDIIKENLSKNGMDVVWAIDEQLKPVFPYYRGELEFQLGFNDSKGEFFFFYKNNKNLLRDAQTLKSMMPPELEKSWEFMIEP